MLVQEQNFDRAEDTQMREFCNENIPNDTEKKIEVTPKDIKQLVLDVIIGTGWSESTQKIMDQVVDPDHGMINKMKPIEK